jgi:hypothetical protein
MRTYSTEFPDFVLDVIVPSDFTDSSWHNDACPSFAGHRLRLWIDYKDPSMRENNGPRFIIQREDVDGELQNEEDDILLQTDDWNEVIAMIAKLTPHIPRY